MSVEPDCGLGMGYLMAQHGTELHTPPKKNYITEINVECTQYDIRTR